MILFQHIIPISYSIKEALVRLDTLGLNGNVLFVVNEEGILLASLTDGDIRRGLLRGINIEASVAEVYHPNFLYLDQTEGRFDSDKIKAFRERNIKIVPVLDAQRKIVDIILLEQYRGMVPVDVFILAGGKGERLLPLTKDCPKPMLHIGPKPIVEHNIDRLISFGVKHFTLSINYLGTVISNYFQTGQNKGVKINYVEETSPLGTIGSISLVESFGHGYVLVMNSDLLTDINFADFFDAFVSSGSDMSIATIPYHVDIPYAVLETTTENSVKALAEKPRYTYYANAGIYLIKKECLGLVPRNTFYNATDLIEAVIATGGKVSSFPILGYWLDIGKMPDYLKAQEDIKHLKL